MGTLAATPTPEELLRQIDNRIEALGDRKVEVEDEAVRIEDEMTRLRRTRETLSAPGRRRRTRGTVRKTKVRSAETQAGPGNVRKVEAALAQAGRVTQAVLTDRVGLHSGTMTYALRALEERGRARRTGEKVRRSPVYEIVKDSVKMPPGSGR